MTFNPNQNPTVSVSVDAAAVGRSSTNSFLTVYQNRDPTASDVNYPIQQRWINLNASFFTGTEFILTSYTNSTGVLQAVWIALGTASIVTATLTGNSGGAVPVNNMNTIFVVGDGTTITTDGNPGANTLTISTAGTVATSYVTDLLGPAIPIAGVLQVKGGTGVQTSGATNVITINAMGSVPLQFTEDGSTTAVPSMNNINVFGGTGIATLGSGSTITIEVDGDVATKYTTDDTNSAIPAANVLIVHGGTGITTSSSGNTVTITNTSVASIRFNEDSGFATPTAGVINIKGGTGISTMGDGANNITITATGGTAIAKVINQTFTSTGTYTPSAGMLYCQIQILGGGAAGGGSGSAGGGQYAVGSGGGGGEYAFGTFTAAAIGAGQVVTIGAGGTGVNGANGNNGGNTSLGALITAFGGTGGLVGTANSVGGQHGGAGGTGGAGGNYRTPGFNGTSGNWSVISGDVLGANGANSQLGSGGFPGLAFSSNGNPGLGYGSGGGGSVSSAGVGGPAFTGGNGAPGIVVITEYTT